MLRTRLWMGAILIVLMVGALAVDRQLAPWYPILFFLLFLLEGIACFELLSLLPAERRPTKPLAFGFLLLILAANWVPHLLPAEAGLDRDPWHWILGTFMAVAVSTFLYEMATFREPGESVTRIALMLWLAVYVGLLPSFLAQLRWLPARSAEGSMDRATLALGLTIFVPKCCDIGAYFTGRFLGKHRMAPVLSPKKTWEGAVGGLAAAVATTIGLDRLGPVLPSFLAEVGFGLTVGAAGMLGDLAESLIKRDCRQKDASQVVPGFGGVLDVVDAVLFAAPIAYLWLIH